MTVERWWPHAVICEVQPGSLSPDSSPGDTATLRRLAPRLDDLQTLGVDAVLLRGVEVEPQRENNSTKFPVAAIDPRYGTLEDFDQLVNDSVRHGIRVMVALRPGLHGQALMNDARFWLNRGVTGLALSGGQPAEVRSLKTALRTYVGERILIVEKTSGEDPFGALVEQASSPSAGRKGSSQPTDRPDLLRILLPPLSQGAAPLRLSLERARSLLAAHASVPMLSRDEEDAASASARTLATVLLGSGGATLLHIDDLDLSHATDTHPGSVFAWYRQWSGLHRGNAVMRSGDDILLNHDGDGALVWVRQLQRGSAPVVAICNITRNPVRLSLVDDMQRLRLRGSFLRTLARSDGGMGAMPLREVALPPFSVYVGELSR